MRLANNMNRGIVGGLVLKSTPTQPKDPTDEEMVGMIAERLRFPHPTGGCLLGSLADAGGTSVTLPIDLSMDFSTNA